MANKKYIKIKEFCFLFSITTILFILASYILGIEPFGTNTFFVYDAEDQYFDFFIYFKRFLNGEVNFDYSFSKSLGGSLYALYAYYLSSPINYIILLFDIDKIYIGFYVVTLIKIALCATTFNLFLYYRFEKLDIYVRFALSLAYAFMQYNITQMQNIMWLDGVVLLPLMLLAVHWFVKNDNKIFLYFMVMISIIFNWYTAYMNCIFVVLFFIVEMICMFNVKGPKEWLIKIGRFLAIEFLGVLGSMFFFAPAIVGILQGKGVENNNIFRVDVSTDIINMFSGYNMGNKIGIEPSFYCGILCFVLPICFFIDKHINKRLRISYFALLCFMIFSCWFLPIQNIWNGFRFAYSYFYRFSYIICAIYIIILAFYIENAKERKFNKLHCFIMVIYILFTVGMYQMDKLETDTAFYCTIIFSLIWLCYIFFYKAKKIDKWGVIVLLGIMVLELETNTVLLCNNIYNREFGYTEFYTDQTEIVNYIKKSDSSEFYRMEQTDPYTRWCFSEALSYNYQGIAHYSSAYDEKTGKFLRKLGYTDYGKASIYREPVLTADSLLGTKYIWSKRQQEEFMLLADVAGYHIYKNEYALPLGFNIAEKEMDIDKYTNPFIFQNELYTKILGKKTELFQKVEVQTRVQDGNLYIYNEKNRKGFLYGYVRSKENNLELYVNGEHYYPYSVFMSSLVFDCGWASEKNEIKLTNTEKTDAEIEIWALDIEKYKEVVEEIQKDAIKVIKFEDGHIIGNYHAKEDGNIMLTIPNTSQWNAKVNGVDVSVQEAYETFITIPVVEGENEIVLEYQLPGRKEGIAVSCISVLMMAWWSLLRQKKSVTGYY